ncbi:MAG: hypothetical protein E6H07_14380 [Bacteroidetes bacterium]|nr:MAG: hypothetical protein E6H07_14380 [Bacteroidota bacterium]
MARAIKYLLNIGGLVLMWWMTILSYGLIVRIPPCDQIRGVVIERIKELTFSGLIYLCLVTFLNWFIQQKFEKRLSSREFLYLSAINLAIIVLFVWHYTNQFVGLCGS